jgi:hypothetical protein
MKKIISLLLLGVAINCWAQQKPIDSIYKKVDVVASYANLYKMIEKTQFNDTTNCFKTGNMYVDFIVHKDGTLSNYSLSDSSTMKCKNYYEQFLKVLKRTSGYWKVATLQNKKVSSYFQVSINFILPDEE